MLDRFMPAYEVVERHHVRVAASAEVTLSAAYDTKLPADEFAAFHEPGYVKIAWTLRADPIDPSTSVFLTETRAVTTDPAARARFRPYWSFLSPGIVLIRSMSLGLVKAEAERRVRATGAEQSTQGLSKSEMSASSRPPSVLLRLVAGMKQWT